MVRRAVQTKNQYGSPYSQTNTFGGQQANGGYGARTDESQKNADLQRRPGNRDGAAGFGDLVAEWSRRMLPAREPRITPTSPSGQPFVPEPAQQRYLQSLMRGTGGFAPGGAPRFPLPNEKPVDIDEPDIPRDSGGFIPGPPGAEPPMDTDAYKTKGIQLAPRMETMNAVSGGDQGTDSSGGRAVGQPEPLPPGVSADAYNRMVRYAAEDPRYSWLVPNAWVWDEYVAEVSRLAGAYGEEHIDFVDWLHNRFPGDALGANPLYQRRGYDSYTHMQMPDGSIVPRQGNQGGGTWFDDGGNIIPPPASGPFPGSPAGPQNPVPTEPGPPAPPPTEEPPPSTEPPPNPAVPPVEPPVAGPPSKAPHSGTPVDPGFGAPTYGGGLQTPPPQPPIIPPTVEPPVLDPNANGPQGGGFDVYAELQKLLDPSYQREHDSLNRYARAASAVGGGLADDSGGFGANLLEAHSGLSADQGKRMSDYLMTGDQAAKERALQRYMTDRNAGVQEKQIDASIAIAELNADVQRFGITTNAGLETQKLELEKYGIDKNDLLERYKQELQLKGVQYSSDKQVDAAALQAAASKSIAAANRVAAARNAEMDFLLGRERLTQQERESQRGYDLGIFGINSNIYRADLDDRYRYMYLQWLMSPENRASGGGFPPLPGGSFVP